MNEFVGAPGQETVNGDEARAQWLSVLASSPLAALSKQWDGLEQKPDFRWLKKPEHGAILLQGRISSNGAPFNCGEMTVTRCSVQLVDGPLGVAYVPGRSKRHAMIAALLDGLLQTTGPASVRARTIVEMLARANEAEKRASAAKTQESRVSFSMSVTE